MKLTRVRRDEDGKLNLREGDSLTVRAVLSAIDSAANWDEIEPDVYRVFCEDIDINYDGFDDPDELYEAMEAAVSNFS